MTYLTERQRILTAGWIEENDEWELVSSYKNPIWEEDDYDFAVDDKAYKYSKILIPGTVVLVVVGLSCYAFIHDRRKEPVSDASGTPSETENKTFVVWLNWFSARFTSLTSFLCNTKEPVSDATETPNETENKTSAEGLQEQQRPSASNESENKTSAEGVQEHERPAAVEEKADDAVLPSPQSSSAEDDESLHKSKTSNMKIPRDISQNKVQPTEKSEETVQHETENKISAEEDVKEQQRPVVVEEETDDDELPSPQSSSAEDDESLHESKATRLQIPRDISQQEVEPQGKLEEAIEMPDLVEEYSKEIPIAAGLTTETLKNLDHHCNSYMSNKQRGDDLLAHAENILDDDQLEILKDAAEVADDVHVTRAMFAVKGVDPDLATKYAMDRRLKKMSDKSREETEMKKMEFEALLRHQESQDKERQHQEMKDAVQYDSDWLSKLNTARYECYNAAAYGLTLSIVVALVGRAYREVTMLLERNETIFKLVFRELCGCNTDDGLTQTPYFEMLRTCEYSCVGRWLVLGGMLLFVHYVICALKFPKWFHHIANILAAFICLLPLYNPHRVWTSIVQLLLSHLLLGGFSVIVIRSWYNSTKDKLQEKGDSLRSSDTEREVSSYGITKLIVSFAPSALVLFCYQGYMGSFFLKFVSLSF